MIVADWLWFACDAYLSVWVTIANLVRCRCGLVLMVLFKRYLLIVLFCSLGIV